MLTTVQVSELKLAKPDVTSLGWREQVRRAVSTFLTEHVDTPVCGISSYELVTYIHHSPLHIVRAVVNEELEAHPRVKLIEHESNRITRVTLR